MDFRYLIPVKSCKKLGSIELATAFFVYSYSNDIFNFSFPPQEALWEALKSRDIDLVISDHSPCTVDLKLLDRGDFMAAWGGIAGVQYGG